MIMDDRGSGLDHDVWGGEGRSVIVVSGSLHVYKSTNLSMKLCGSLTVGLRSCFSMTIAKCCSASRRLLACLSVFGSRLVVDCHYVLQPSPACKIRDPDKGISIHLPPNIS